MNSQNSFININCELSKLNILLQSLQNENRTLKQEKIKLETENNYKKKIVLIENLLDYSRNNPMAANEFRESLSSILKE